MASIYSEDIGFIKATIKAMHEDMQDSKKVQDKQQIAIDALMADAAFRRKLARIGRTIFFVIVAVATLKFGDIKGLF